MVSPAVVSHCIFWTYKLPVAARIFFRNKNEVVGVVNCFLHHHKLLNVIEYTSMLKMVE